MAGTTSKGSRSDSQTLVRQSGSTSKHNREKLIWKENLKRGIDPRYWLYRLRWHLTGKKTLLGRYIPRMPLHLDIELSYVCNFKCTMCPQSYDQNAKGVMKPALARYLIEQAADMGVPSIKWNWRGEATLHRNIAEFTRYAKSLGIPEVQMNTNGNWRGTNVKEMIDAGIDRLIFSVDGDTEGTFESIRIGGCFEELKDTIEEAVKYRNKMGLAKPFIRVQFCKQKANAHEVDGFIDRWMDVVDDVRVSKVMDRGQDGFMELEDMVSVGRAFCQQPFQRLTIGYDGKVMGCCADWFENRPVGDANRHTLRKIWNTSVNLQDMRNAQIHGYQDAISPCDNCWAKDGYEWKEKEASLNVIN